MKTRSLGILTLALGLVFSSVASHASVIYQWVCDDPSCNGDPAFTSTLAISDGAFAAGSFTGVAGNILSWNTTSGIGDGYTLTLGDMLTGLPSAVTDDVNHVQMVLNADGSEVSDLLDITAGTNITFFDASIGRVDFFEGTGGGYSVGSLQDLAPGQVISSIIVGGRFVRAVPEPTTLGLLGAGLLGLAFVRRRRAA